MIPDDITRPLWMIVQHKIKKTMFLPIFEFLCLDDAIVIYLAKMLFSVLGDKTYHPRVRMIWALSAVSC